MMHRMEIYEEQTAPLIDFYRAKACLVSVNGEQVVRAIHDDLVSQLTQLKKIAG